MDKELTIRNSEIDLLKKILEKELANTQIELKHVKQEQFDKLKHRIHKINIYEYYIKDVKNILNKLP